MSSLPRRSRTLSLALAAALAVAAPVGLTGCSQIADLIQTQTGGQVDLGGTEVPADFPAEVPLIDGDVLYGAAVGTDSQKVWNVTITVGDGALEMISGQFTDAGYAATPVTETARGSAITFTKDDLTVLVVIGTQGDNQVANYTVTTAASNG